MPEFVKRKGRRSRDKQEAPTIPVEKKRQNKKAPLFAITEFNDEMAFQEAANGSEESDVGSDLDDGDMLRDDFGSAELLNGASGAEDDEIENDSEHISAGYFLINFLTTDFPDYFQTSATTRTPRSTNFTQN